MNTLTTKALIVLLSVFILLMVGSQIYYRLNDRHKTEEAVLCNINENVPFKGVVVRNEKVITSSVKGVYEYLYANGSKVASGSHIANVYPDEQSLIDKKNADNYSARAQALENAQNPGNSQYVQPDTLNGRIDSEYKKLMYSLISGDRSGYEASSDELFSKLNIYNVITNQSSSYTKEINELKSKSSELSKGESSVKTVSIEESGYFVSYCDGYETSLSPDNLERLSRSDVEAIISGSSKHEVPENAIGKVFDDYSCYIAAVLPKDKRISVGEYLNIRLGNSDNMYSVRVEHVGDPDEENRCVTVMTCNRLDSDIAQSRVLSFELVFDEYQGIKVPRDAIRFKNNNEKGVYVILGNEVTFKLIDVIYEGTDFVVSRNTSDAKHLLLYDQILLEAVSNQDGTDESDGSASDDPTGVSDDTGESEGDPV